MKLFDSNIVKIILLIFAFAFSPETYAQKKLKIFISVDMEGIGGVELQK